MLKRFSIHCFILWHTARLSRAFKKRRDLLQIMDKYKSSCTEDHSKMTKISCLAIGQGIEREKKEFLDCGSGGSRSGIILSFNASSPGKKQKDHFILLCTMNTFGSSWISSPGLDDNLSADLAWPNPLVTKSVKLCCKGLPDQTSNSCYTSKYI